MPLESEVTMLLYGGFFAVIALNFVVILVLWLRNKDKTLIWFVVQFVLLIVTFRFFELAVLLKPDVPRSMLSEENSLILGLTGVFWALSMLSMLIGIWQLGRRKDVS
ncbi:MAG: hypothetical protein SCK29_03990 [Bacillota bacterium]|nr:hypothetical protein [Bacillota bacterium]MDW7683268.1 hypothetical protein [Bacillota bacterium]